MNIFDFICKYYNLKILVYTTTNKKIIRFYFSDIHRNNYFSTYNYSLLSNNINIQLIPAPMPSPKQLYSHLVKYRCTLEI